MIPSAADFEPDSKGSELESASPPPPQEAGADGTQVTPAAAPASASVVLSSDGIDQRHLGAVLHDYADSRSPLLAAVAVAAFDDARGMREAFLRRLNDAEREKETLRDKYHDEREKRIASENRTLGRGALDAFKQYCFGVGGLIVGVGVTVYFANPQLHLLGVVITGVGLPLLGLGAPFLHRGDSQ